MKEISIPDDFNPLEPVSLKWEKAKNYIQQRDPTMVPLIEPYATEQLSGSGEFFRTLANAIVGQQISVHAAGAIWKRLENSFPGLSLKEISRAEISQLRSLGLSLRKSEYLQSLANSILNGEIRPEQWIHLEDHQIESELVKLRGIGPWTAQMFLIFYLHRPDVLPILDIGLLNAAGKFLGHGPRMEAPAMIERAKIWRPYRTVATWYLWRNIDADPIVY